MYNQEDWWLKESLLLILVLFVCFIVCFIIWFIVWFYCLLLCEGCGGLYQVVCVCTCILGCFILGGGGLVFCLFLCLFVFWGFGFLWGGVGGVVVLCESIFVADREWGLFGLVMEMVELTKIKLLLYLVFDSMRSRDILQTLILKKFCFKMF